jgi:hypothetical protein
VDILPTVFGTKTISTFTAGDTYLFRLGGTLSMISGNILTVSLQDAGGNTLATLPLVAFTISGGADISMYFTFKTIGGAGVASVESQTIFTYGSGTQSNAVPNAFFNNTTIDTTAPITLSLNATWASANPGDTITINSGYLNKVF